MTDTTIYNRIIDILKNPAIKMEYTRDNFKVVYGLNAVYDLTRLTVDITDPDGKHIARHILHAKATAPEIITMVAQYLPGDSKQTRRAILDDLLYFINVHHQK